MSSCTDQMIEPEIIPTRSIRDLTYKDVPNVVSQLQEGLGLRGGNDRLSVNDEGRTYGVIIDWNRITELIDTVGNVNYTFAVVDEDEDPYTFHNLIIGKNEEGYWKRPYLLTYVMGEEFRSKYDATGSTEGFTGRLLKRYISPSTSDSRRGVVNNYEDPYTSNDPCDRETEVISVGSGGGDDPYTEFEAPTPGMGNTFCYTYWYYFETSTICGNDGYFTDCEMGVRRPFLVTECIEYGGSMAGSDPCDQDMEEVAVIEPELRALLWEVGICETDAFKSNSCLSGVWTKLKQSNKAYKLVEKFTRDQPMPIDLCMDSKTTLGTDKANVGGVTYRENGSVKIDFNATLLSQHPELITAQSMIHEIIHAEMFRKIISAGGSVSINDFPGIYDYYSRYMPLRDKNGSIHYPNGSPQHNLMSEHYITIIAEALMEYDGAIGTYEQYEAIAWIGLETTSVWSSKTGQERSAIKSKAVNFLLNRPNCN